MCVSVRERERERYLEECNRIDGIIIHQEFEVRNLWVMCIGTVPISERGFSLLEHTTIICAGTLFPMLFHNYSLISFVQRTLPLSLYILTYSVCYLSVGSYHKTILSYLTDIKETEKMTGQVLKVCLTRIEIMHESTIGIRSRFCI